MLSPGRVPLTLGFLSASPSPSTAITALKETVGWRYSMLFVGLLQLNLVVCGVSKLHAQLMSIELVMPSNYLATSPSLQDSL